MLVLLTGATGKVGRQLMDKLLAGSALEGRANSRALAVRIRSQGIDGFNLEPWSVAQRTASGMVPGVIAVAGPLRPGQ